MDKIAVIGDYDSIYGFQTLGLSICPVRDAEEGKEKLRQLDADINGDIDIRKRVKEIVSTYQLKED